MAKEHFGRRGRNLSGTVGALAVAAFTLVCAYVVAPAEAAQAEQVCLHEDVLIAGKQLHSFSAEGESVSVVLGGFSLSIGRRTLSGRDGVVWIREHRVGQQVYRDIRVYVEGDAARPAQVVEPDGTTTKDRVLFVILRQRGALRARVKTYSDESVKTLPLYQRAGAVRKGLTSRPAMPTSRERPPLPTTGRAEALHPPYEPVAYTADETTSKVIPDPRDPEAKVRRTIAKGNVYLFQGNPDSDLFLEIRADAAVLYTDPKAETRPDQAVTAAYAVIAAYLEGDVILRLGERSVQGDRLFYDFRTGKALILQPVLRIIQEQRNIPVYIRAKEARQLAARRGPEGVAVRGYQWTFRDALVTTSDFHTPEYHIAARRVYLQDTTPYDEKGVALAERSWQSRLVNTTFNVRGVPLLWWPYTVGDAEQGHTALRKVQAGRHGRFGWGVESHWFLFRLLGLPKPEGWKARLEVDWYERGLMLGSKVQYRRQKYSGEALAYGLLDDEREDDFGTRRKGVGARRERGRLLWRHKQFLPRDWQLQMESSYLCDKNFLEQFFPGEFWAGKEQETLLYAKKQQDNWAVTGLAKWRINDFLTQTEALPDLAGYLIGQSLLKDMLTLHSEGHLGLVRYRPAEDSGMLSTRTVARADMRQEVDLPLALGPIKFLPYAAGRVTYWGDSPRDGGLVRQWGQVGVNAAVHIWRIYNGVKSRLWNLNRIKHVITPYGGVFWSGSNVEPDRLSPFSADIEQNVRRMGGARLGVRQLWQTKRGPAENQHAADWLRMNVYATLFDGVDTRLRADGRYFFYRPEYSLPRNSVNGDLLWHISDSATVLGDVNYDMDSGKLGRGSAGIAVTRAPRFKYYAGIRCINGLDSSVGTFGVNYRINRKYTVNVFEQYDFNRQGGQNLGTSVTIVRKFPRLYTALTFVYDRSQDDVGIVMSIWPEGIPEARIGGTRLSLLQGTTERD